VQKRTVALTDTPSLFCTDSRVQIFMGLAEVQLIVSLT
jgi:hypothetical protein